MGEVGVLEGCIPLVAVAGDVVPEWHSDPDFVEFGVVADEIEALPFGAVRERWSAAALVRADVEIARYSDVMRERISSACRSVVARFGATTDETAEGDSAV